jgi:transmembrane sensor
MELKNGKDIKFLLGHFQEDKLTTREIQLLSDLLSASENEKEFKEILFSLLSDFDLEPGIANKVDFSSLYNKILTSIKQKELLDNNIRSAKRKLLIKRIVVQTLSAAAVFLIAFYLGRLLPVTKAAALNNHSEKAGYNLVHAPFGSKSEVLLPDSTKVILNSGSTLTYNKDFNVSDRDVKLTGEAYFTVAQGIAIPFNVKAGNIIIKALGTEFNVKAYEDEGIIETTLIKGKVGITQSGQYKEEESSLDLIPNQKAIYFKETGTLKFEETRKIDSTMTGIAKIEEKKIVVVPKADVDQILAWVQGKLVIRGETLENLCVQLQRKYNVSFEFKNEEIKRIRFSGILLDETLEQVLNVIELTAPINYYLEGKIVYLSTDREKLDNYSRHLKE